MDCKLRAKNCGGCPMLGMDYAAQLKQKEETVKKLLGRFGPVEHIRGMETPYHYRNKVISTFTTGWGGKLTSGIYAANSHKVLPVESCLLQDEVLDKTMQAVRAAANACRYQPYDEDKGTGLVRHCLLRRGVATGQVMVVLVTAQPVLPGAKNFVKALLAEAGYPNGEGFPTVQLSFYSDDNVKKIAEAIAEMWQTNLGIQVEVTSSDWAVFYDAVQAGEYDVAAMGWSADYVNPMSFLPLLYTDDVSNNVFYSNKDYDAVVDQIKVEKDSTKFAELVMQADEIASNEYPVLPLYYKSNNYLLKDYVKGVYMTSSSNIYFKDAQVLAH